MKRKAIYNYYLERYHLRWQRAFKAVKYDGDPLKCSDFFKFPIHNFFVPTRILWENFDSFIGVN